MLESLLAWDEELFLTLNSLGQPWLDQFMVMISEIWIWVPLYAVILFLFYKKFPLNQALVFMALCVLTVVITDQGSVHLFKEVFKRPRPCQEEHLLTQMRFAASHCGLYGFISSHAANTFGFAVLAGGILKEKAPKLPVILLIWAAVVSYSRIYLGVHYPLDVIGGAIFGSVIGVFMLKIANKRLAISSLDPKGEHL